MALLALNLAFYSGDPYPDLVHLGQQAEESGYDCLMVPEAIEGNDALLCCHMLAAATSRVRIATNVANIYLRAASLCAVSAATVQQASHGRFILGIGPSHRPVLQAMGIEMGNARDHLREYTMELRKAFGGERAKNLGIHFPHPGEPVPIYFGALTRETARMGGELADGLLLVHCTAQRLSQMIRAAHESARQFGRRPDVVTICTSVQAYVHDDIKVAREAARSGMALYMGLPYYNRLLRNSGFAAEAQAGAAAWQKGDKAAMAAAASDRLIDAVTLCGPASHCRERMAALSESGVDMIGIMPGAVGGEDPLFSVKRCLAALAPR
jgi:alkanesulfonate monooxygenase SsuD/methylene tetrahydromethanopterin reductase-like flavin-dependent oxidoreductase (luciferase family)